MDWMDSNEVTEILKKHLDDKEYVMDFLQNMNWPNPQMEAMPEELRDDEDVVFCLVNRSSAEKNFSFASERLKKDKAFIRRLFSVSFPDIQIIKYCDISLRSDKEFILSLDLPKHGSMRSFCLLQFLSPELQDDDEIVYQCCQSEMGSIAYASDRLKQDKDFVLSILHFKTCIGPIYYILKGEPILQDPEFIEAVFERTGEIDFEGLPDNIRNDVVWALKALHGSLMPYYYCVDAVMSMYDVASPFAGTHSIHISREVLENPLFARMVADQYFESEMGKPHKEKYPHNHITDIYAIMSEIALEGHLYWYWEQPEDRFDFTEEIKQLSK